MVWPAPHTPPAAQTSRGKTKRMMKTLLETSPRMKRRTPRQHVVEQGKLSLVVSQHFYLAFVF